MIPNLLKELAESFDTVTVFYGEFMGFADLTMDRPADEVSLNIFIHILESFVILYYKGHKVKRCLLVILYIFYATLDGGSPELDLCHSRFQDKEV